MLPQTYQSTTPILPATAKERRLLSTAKALFARVRLSCPDPRSMHAEYAAKTLGRDMGLSMAVCVVVCALLKQWKGEIC